MLEGYGLRLTLSKGPLTTGGNKKGSEEGVSVFISATAGENKEESEGERWYAYFCNDEREPKSEDDTSVDEAVLYAEGIDEFKVLHNRSKSGCS